MTTLNYPKVSEYSLPKKNILVISCIDLRLTDNLVDFLNFDNLHNRYDHFILAGASLTHSAPPLANSKKTHEVRNWKKGATIIEKKYKFTANALRDYNHFEHWKDSLYDHINLAVELHKIHDVYIIEHQDCGAYKEFLDVTKNKKYNEKECHKEFAEALAQDINSKEYKIDKEKVKLNVHCFYIDLRGNVEHLYST